MIDRKTVFLTIPTRAYRVRFLALACCLSGLAACSGNGAPLMEENNRELVTQPTPAMPAGDVTPALAGSWQLISLRQQGESVAISQEFSVPSLDIAVDSGVEKTVKISGYTGVNRLNTSAKLVGHQGIDISPQIITTRRAGPPAAMEMEQRFLQLLRSVDRYRLINSELQPDQLQPSELHLEQGNADSVMRLKRKLGK